MLHASLLRRLCGFSVACSLLQWFQTFEAERLQATEKPHSRLSRLACSINEVVSDVLSNTKGLIRFATDDKSSDHLINAARKSAQALQITLDFKIVVDNNISLLQWFQTFEAERLQATEKLRLEGLEPLQKTDVVINNNLEVQRDLQALSKLVDSLRKNRTVA
jgi:hypothetical protein